MEGVANANPSPLHVFPYFEVDDCDGPIQGHLAKINVTIKDAPDFPDERIYFNETVINMTGLHVKEVKVMNTSFAMPSTIRTAPLRLCIL